MPRLKSVTALEGFILELTWDDGRRECADLSGLIAINPHFFVFSKDQDAFHKVQVINWGHGVEWENGLDYSAENLARIAAEQTTTDDAGTNLIKDFQDHYKLTNEQLGQAIGYKTSQIKNFKSGSPIPAAVRTAIVHMNEQPTLLYARVRNSAVRKHA